MDATRTVKWVATMALLAVTPSHALDLLSADEQRGWFAGIGYGTVQLEGRCSAIGRETNILTACEHNDASGAWRLRLGYRWNRYLAAEAGYAVLGASDRYFAGVSRRPSRLPGGIPFTAKSRFEIRGYTLGATFSWPMTARASLYGKAGGFLWHQRFEAEISLPSGAYSTAKLESGPDSTGGVGIEYRLHDNWAMRVGWEYFAADGDHHDYYHLDLLWLQGRS